MTLRATTATPVTRSVTDIADLEAIDCSFLIAGDNAFVDTGSQFWIYFPTSTAAVSATVRATANSNAAALPGRWVLAETLVPAAAPAQVVNNYVQPAIDGNVTMTLTSSSLSINEIFYVPGGGYYEVVTNNGDSTYDMRNIGGSGTVDAGVVVTGGRNVYVSSSVDGVIPLEVDAPGYVQPAVGANVVVPFTTQPTWAVIGEILYVPGGGYYEVEAIGVNQLTLSNTGATGNAAPLTAILAGTIAVPLAQAGQQISATTPISFPTIAALAAFNDVEIPDNSVVWVESVRALWRKKIEADLSLSDDITNIRNPGNTATWYREATADSSWVYLYYGNDCFVDAVAGDDENDGASALAPLQSLNEISRRLACDPIAAEISFTIHVGAGGISDYVSDNQSIEQTLVVPNGMQITLSGLNANAVAFATVLASQDYTPATVPQTVADRQQVTVDAGFTWVRDRLYINTNDTRQIGWALSGADSGAFGAASADTHFTWSGAPFTAPAVGNVINEYVLPVADTLRIIGGSRVTIDALEISSISIKNSSLPTIRRSYLTVDMTAENVELLTVRHCRLALASASDSACQVDGGLALLDTVIENILYVSCASLETRRCSVNGAAVVGGVALIQVVGGVVSGSRTTRSSATRVVCDNVELRDNGFLLFGKAAANANMDAAPMDVTFAGTTATPSYIFGRDNVAVTEPIKLLNAGIRLGYNGNAAGTPTAGSGTIVTVTHTSIATTYSYANPGGVDPTVLVNAGLPSVNAANFVGIYRYL